MPCVIRYPAILAILLLLVLMLSLSVRFALKSIILVFLGILLVIFLLFVLANMMTRPELFPDMTPFGLLLMALTCLSRKGLMMLAKVRCLIKGLCSHIFGGCSVCVGFARHFAKTVVQILKGGDSNAES